MKCDEPYRYITNGGHRSVGVIHLSSEFGTLSKYSCTDWSLVMYSFVLFVSVHQLLVIRKVVASADKNATFNIL